MLVRLSRFAASLCFAVSIIVAAAVVLRQRDYAAVREVYAALGRPDRVRYHWYAGDHDFPPAARKAAVEWFKKWFELTE